MRATIPPLPARRYTLSRKAVDWTERVSDEEYAAAVRLHSQEAK